MSIPEIGRAVLKGALARTTEGASGALKVGVSAIAGVTGSNVQAALESLKGLLDEKANSSHSHAEAVANGASGFQSGAGKALEHERGHKLWSSLDHTDVDASTARANGQVVWWDSVVQKFKTALITDSLLALDRHLPMTVANAASRPATARVGKIIYQADTKESFKNTGTEQAPVWEPVAGGGGPAKGHMIGGSYRWNSATGYTVEPGEAVVAGKLLSWAAGIPRSALALAASSIHYIYLFDNAGTPAVTESTAVPAWDASLGYHKLGGAAPDASRRCIGFLRTDAAGAIYRFAVAAVGRTREWTIMLPGGVPNIDPVIALSAGSDSTLWRAIDLSIFLPLHATHFFAAAKIAFPAAGDDAIIGISPVDLGASLGYAGSYTVRDSAPKANSKTFFGRSWLPLVEPRKTYYRLHPLAGSPTAEVECHGARFVA